MDKKRPFILISNDDGYHAKGLRSLVAMLSDLGDILVCAPESARSAESIMEITLQLIRITAERWVLRWKAV